MKVTLKFIVLYLLSGFVFQPALAQGDCAAHPVAILGNSLAPMILNGSSVMMKPASCAGGILRGDLVIFRTGAHEQPVIKIVKAILGDHFSVEDGYIIVNGEKLTTSTGVPYYLSKSHAAMLLLYQHSYKGIIPPDSYLVLGDKPGGATDSTRIGLVHRSDMLMVGKVKEN